MNIVRLDYNGKLNIDLFTSTLNKLLMGLYVEMNLAEIKCSLKIIKIVQMNLNG